MRHLILGVFFLCISTLAVPLYASPLTTENFSQLPDVNNVVLSPSGNKLVSEVRINSGKIQGTGVEVLDLATKEKKIVLFTDNSEFFIHWFWWKDNKTLLVGVFNPSERDTFTGAGRFRYKTRDYHLMLIDTESGEVTRPFKRSFWQRYKLLPAVRDNVIDVLPDDPDHILMQISGLDRGYETDPLVYKVNIKNQRNTVLQSPQKNVTEWVTDQQHRVRLGHSFDDKGNQSTKLLDLETGKWVDLWSHKVFSEEAVEALGFDVDPNILFVRAYHNKRLAIFKVNLKDPKLKRELVFSDPEYDASGELFYSPITKAAIGIIGLQNGVSYFFDKDMQSLQNKIDKALLGNRNYIHSISDDMKTFVVFSTSSIDSGTYYLGQRDPVKLNAIAYSYNKLSPELMSKSQQIRYKTRDGLTLKAFLTLPKSASRKNLPTIMFPQGPAPMGDDYFNYWTQFFVSKGYAVLQMNYRGLGGQGIELRNAGLKNWGKEMQDDIEDSARNLIAEGIADPSAISIVGTGYGGYAALMGVVKTPDLYRCAISVNGIANVFDFVRDRRIPWRGYNVVEEAIGNLDSNLRVISPVNSADKIKVPVLLIHGTDNRQIEIKHSYQMRDALQKAKKDVTFLELPSEDHYLSNEKNRMDTFRAMDSFLDKCLPVKTEKVAALQ